MIQIVCMCRFGFLLKHCEKPLMSEEITIDFACIINTCCLYFYAFYFAFISFICIFICLLTFKRYFVLNGGILFYEALFPRSSLLNCDNVATVY